MKRNTMLLCCAVCSLVFFGCAHSTAVTPSSLQMRFLSTGMNDTIGGPIIAISGDGKRAACGTTGNYPFWLVSLFDASTGTVIKRLPNARLSGIELDHDGSHVLSTDSVAVVDVATGTSIALSSKSGFFSESSDTVYGYSFPWASKLYAYSKETGQELFACPIPIDQYLLRLSPDAHNAILLKQRKGVGGGDLLDSVWLIDPITQAVTPISYIHTLGDGLSAFYRMRFSPDGSLLGFLDLGNRSLEVYNTLTGVRVADLSPFDSTAASATTFDFSSDNATVVTTHQVTKSSASIHFIDLKSGVVTKTLSGIPTQKADDIAFSFSDDASRMAIVWYYGAAVVDLK